MIFNIFGKFRKQGKGFRGRFIEELLNLVASGFGLIAALAWNEVIQELVTSYIKPFFGEASGFITLIIYAIIVTLLAVSITYNLTKIARKN